MLVNVLSFLVFVAFILYVFRGKKMGLFKKEASLEEMEEEHSLLKERRTMLEEKVAIKQLEERLGKGGWKMFSSNGKHSGFSLKSAMNWIKSH